MKRNNPRGVSCLLYFAFLISILIQSSAYCQRENLYRFPIKGFVYEDVNGDNQRNPEEPFLKDIPVSDGQTIQFTSDDGRFHFANDEQNAKYIFVCTPNGFQKRADFYRILLDLKIEQEFAFGLRKIPPENESEFSFAQITDVHINGNESFLAFQKALAEIANHLSKPDFIIATGDVVSSGDDKNQLLLYQKAAHNSPIPVFNLMGNHDRCKGVDKNIAFNYFLGPEYYSFNHGGFHFLILNSITTNTLEQAWIKEDLEKLAKGKKVIAFQHYPPYNSTIQKFVDWGVYAVFSGHWHSSKLSVYKGIRCINTPCLLFGGIDFSPSGFRIVRARYSDFSTEYIPTRNPNLAQKEKPSSSPLSLIWRTPSGGTIDFSSPIHLENMVIIGIKDRNDNGPNGVLALNASTGEKVWFAKTDTAVNNSPVSYKNFVIAQEMGGRVHAFDSRTGNEVWHYDCLDPHFRWLYGAPVIHDGKVFAGSSKWFASVDAASGREIWHNDDGYDWISSYCSPSIGEGKVLFGGNWLTIGKKKHGVYAMDIATGKRLWGCDVIGVHGAAAIRNGHFYINDIEGNFCVGDMANGKIIWKYPMIPSRGKWNNNWSPVTPVLKDNIAITGSSAGTIFAIDVDKKAIVWQYQTGESIYRCAPYNTDYRSLLSTPALSGDLVFIGSGDGSIYIFDITTGKKKGEYVIGAPVLSKPLIMENRLFVGSYDGNIYAFDIAR
ncbi:MAG TPA: PQQ-binding-like beta-propeller repeat protein [Candidatus Sumerlaeota bacterium]|nr:PQQ-binding-like beta-propeller repeat protein [Candidatus Sumerlaeota bacterium]HON51097.1 PQQ-binding-like beta-propeller repeat protein [Candidatus Sumerlaeota bacterium]HOR65024.1 PQQ-binding-like beta-propeller repeat protein [Candidatus Sumerlaeota bacterium]HPL74964.1 PQQ-binding-like beta-propeller repeat protein [Candidatus Sumerlaeota bacterium]